jgi:hypothetical protein
MQLLDPSFEVTGLPTAEIPVHHPEKRAPTAYSNAPAQTQKCVI